MDFPSPADGGDQDGPVIWLGPAYPTEPPYDDDTGSRGDGYIEWVDQYGLMHRSGRSPRLSEAEQCELDAAVAYDIEPDAFAARAREDAWLEWLTGATYAELAEVWRSGRHRGTRAVDLAEQLTVRRQYPHPADLDD